NFVVPGNVSFTCVFSVSTSCRSSSTACDEGALTTCLPSGAALIGPSAGAAGAVPLAICRTAVLSASSSFFIASCSVFIASCSALSLSYSSRDTKSEDGGDEAASCANAANGNNNQISATIAAATV